MTQQGQAQYKIHYSNLFWIAMLHVVALAAIPFYSKTNLIACMIGVFLLAPLTINMTYHRMLAHRAFKAPKWFTYFFTTLGAMLVGGPPVHWAASHRMHHQFSDQNGDPHDSRKGFWYAHMLHLFESTDNLESGADIHKYAPEFAKDKYMMWVDTNWIKLAAVHLVILYAIGGVGMVLWGGILRTVLTWHITWCVNSVCHMWGTRTYKTTDNTRNNWVIGILGAGEGWHNNHHAFPSCAANGRKWFEVDFTYALIRMFEFFGIAYDVKHPVERIATVSPAPTNNMVAKALSAEAEAEAAKKKEKSPEVVI